MPRVKTCKQCDRKATERGLCELHKVLPVFDSLWGSTRGQKLRRYHLAEHPRCHECGEVATEVHHKQQQAARPDLIMALDNLQSMCEACHKSIHGKGDRGGNS